MEEGLNVAVIQMISSSVWMDNLKTASRLVKQAAQDGAKLVVLPEFFIRIANTLDTEFKSIIEPLGEGKIQETLASMAKENKIYLVAGTIPIKATIPDKCYNSLLVYDPSGTLICNYHKIHLFQFDDGTQKYDEGVSFTHGSEVKTLQIGEFNFGLGVCYDIRFPELFRAVAGVDAFIIPAAFLHHTGCDHWEILLRARAIENQCYVIASGQGGLHDNGRHTYGHSMIVNPWGKIKAMVELGEGIAHWTIRKTKVDKVRRELPALQNRRL